MLTDCNAILGLGFDALKTFIDRFFPEEISNVDMMAKRVKAFIIHLIIGLQNVVTRL